MPHPYLGRFCRDVCKAALAWEGWPVIYLNPNLSEADAGQPVCGEEGDTMDLKTTQDYSRPRGRAPGEPRILTWVSSLFPLSTPSSVSSLHPPRRGMTVKSCMSRFKHDGQQAHGKMFNLANYWRHANQNHNEVSPHTGSMTIINMSTNNKCWRACEGKGTLLHCRWECKLV